MNIFVIMPFDSEFDDVYRDLIKAPLEENGHNVNRADDVTTHQSILRGIVQNIANSDLIVADLTSRNPNVFYELGIAHALEKQTLQLVQDLDDVPFDLKSHNVIVYSLRYREAEALSREMLNIIERAENNSYSFTNPVSESLPIDLSISISNEAVHVSGQKEDKESSVDESQMGTLDAIVAAEESAVEISRVAGEIGEQFRILSAKARAHTDKINELNANPNQKGLNSKRLQIIRDFAKDVDYFSNQISPTIPTLRESWETTEQGLVHWITSSNIKNQEELIGIQSLTETIDTVCKSLGENRNVFKAFRDSQYGLRGLSKATDRALSNSDRVLQKLDDEFALGVSVLSRIIDLLREMRNRFVHGLGDIPS